MGVGGGLNVVEKTKQLEEIIGSLHHSGILVSLFIDPDLKQVKEASRLQADYVELHTGGYANARNLIEETEQLGRLKDMAMAGEKLGLGVKVGCGLTYQNVARIIEVPQIEEISIGHAIISRALLVGMEKAVRDMIELVRQARR
ncbi:MAG TPA: pyridoxine 5'-phosphate synthase [Candidatus Latescibacteria bacterium]|nr:pyridoxine 5'-phosphate synthase [Candidatus Latescibacterota bacterium]